jgi:hypothetical protein
MEHNIKMDLKETWQKSVDYIQLAQDPGQWRSLLRKLINLPRMHRPLKQQTVQNDFSLYVVMYLCERNELNKYEFNEIRNWTNLPVLEAGCALNRY